MVRLFSSVFFQFGEFVCLLFVVSISFFSFLSFFFSFFIFGDGMTNKQTNKKEREGKRTQDECLVVLFSFFPFSFLSFQHTIMKSEETMFLWL